MIKLVLFDFNGVTVTGGFEATSAWLAEQLRWGRARWREVYAVLYTKWFTKAQLSEISEPDYWKGALDELGLAVPVDMVRDYHFGTHRLRTGIVPIIRALQRRGVKAALLTKNLREYVPRYVKQFSLDTLFDTVINTQEFGLPKGHPDVIRRTAKQFGVKPTEIIVIDDQQANLAGAKRLGAQAIFYKSLRQLRTELQRTGAL